MFYCSSHMWNPLVRFRQALRPRELFLQDQGAPPPRSAARSLASYWFITVTVTLAPPPSSSHSFSHREAK